MPLKPSILSIFAFKEKRNKPMNKENQIILYQDDNDITRVSVRFADEDLWLTQGQLVEIYQTSKSNVSEHIKHIFNEGLKHITE